MGESSRSTAENFYSHFRALERLERDNVFKYQAQDCPQGPQEVKEVKQAREYKRLTGLGLYGYAYYF